MNSDTYFVCHFSSIENSMLFSVYIFFIHASVGLLFVLKET